MAFLRPSPRLALRSTRCKKPCFRRYSEAAVLPPIVDPAKKDLPPLNTWRQVFTTGPPDVRDRVSVRNPDTARLIVDSFLSDNSSAAGNDKVVIEAFPGPGALSRAMMQLSSTKLRKLIILEEWEPYLEYLRPLEALDPRVTVVPVSGHAWDSYHLLEERGLLNDIEKVAWEDGIHPNLHFVCHLPHTIKGEQLIAQLFRCIPDRAWLFKYGRIPMSFVLGEWVYQRSAAGVDTNPRCKVSVIAEATAKLQLSLSPSVLLPYDDHFHPTTINNPHQLRRPDSRRVGHPLVSLNVIPYAEQVIPAGLLDKWDFCLRRLFVLRKTPLTKAIAYLAPGASVLTKKLTDPKLPPEQRVDVTKVVRNLNIADWALIIRAFDEWPFAPEDLMITDTFSRDD